MRRRARALALLPIALLPGCQTYTWTRSRVLEESDRDEPVALRSPEPSSSSIVGRRLEVRPVESALEPSLPVALTIERRFEYAATQQRRQVVRTRHAKAEYTFMLWPHSFLEGLDPMLVFLGGAIFLPIVVVMDLGVPVYYEIGAFHHAGAALDGSVGTRTVVDEGDARCIVGVTETVEVGDPEPIEGTTSITRSASAAEPDHVVTATWKGARGRLQARTDRSGVARFAIADLAASLPDAKEPLTLVLESGGTTAPIPLSDARLASLAKALEWTLVPDVAVTPPGPDETLAAATRTLLEDGIRAETSGDAPGALVAFGTIVARDPIVAEAHGLLGAVPRLAREVRVAPPEEARAAAAQASRALEANRASDAIGPANEAIARAPWWSEGHRLLAGARALAGDKREACRALATAVALSAPGDPDARLARELLARWMAEGRHR